MGQYQPERKEGNKYFLPRVCYFSLSTFNGNDRQYSSSSSLLNQHGEERQINESRQQQQQQQQQKEEEEEQDSFKVTQMDYATGQMTTINLPPTEILKRTSILPRDLVSLNLTSRQERYGDSANDGTTSSNVVGMQQNNFPTDLRKNSRRLLFRGGGGRTTTRTTLKAKLGMRPPTAILPRKDCILLSFGNIRAVAGRESVYIMDAHSEIAKSFAEDLSALFPLKSSTTSSSSTSATHFDETFEAPELVFLESVLRDTLETFTRRVKLLEPIVNNFVHRVSSEVFSDAGVHLLVPLKDSLQGFELHVKQTFDCLTELLNDDEEMLKLLLTEQEAARNLGTEVDFDRHQDVELLVGVYARQFNNLLQEIHYLLGRLQSKQEFVALALAGYRNRLVRMNVNISMFLEP